jgi:hypothetical protein
MLKSIHRKYLVICQSATEVAGRYTLFRIFRQHFVVAFLNCFQLLKTGSEICRFATGIMRQQIK